jgi:hypothetical protein
MLNPEIQKHDIVVRKVVAGQAKHRLKRRMVCREPPSASRSAPLMSIMMKSTRSSASFLHNMVNGGQGNLTTP